MPTSGNTNLYFEAHKPVFFNKNLYFLKTYTNRLPLPHFITRIFITSIVYILCLTTGKIDTYYTVTNTCLNKLWLSLITLHCCLLALCKLEGHWSAHACDREHQLLASTFSLSKCLTKLGCLDLT